MSKKNAFQILQTKEMDRKDFLKFGGLALVSVIGLKGVVSLLTSPEEHFKHSAPSNKQQTSQGFGGGPYGV